MRHIAYVPSVDGLRGVSIALVVLYHAYPSLLPGGFVGVDVFFVISGYLISTIILASLGEGSFSFIEFYQRRIRRLFPALAVTLALTLGLGLWFMTPGELRELSAHVQAGAGFYSNILLYLQAGYFDAEAGTKPLLHLWSLGVEEQYYLVWPALIVLAARFGRVREAIVLVLVLSFAVNVHYVVPRPAAVFFLPQARMWELAMGALIACHRHDRAFPGFASVGKGAAETLAIAGVALLAAGVALIDASRDFPGWWALLPTLGTACLVAAGEGARVNRLLAARWLVALGKVSYPLYLLHWPLLSFWRIVEPGGDAAIPALILAASVAGSALIHRWIEMRARHVPLGNVSLALAGVVAAIGIFGCVEQRSMPVQGRLAAPYRAFDLPRDMPHRWRDHRCFINALDEGLHAPECVDPPRAGKDALVVLWGDSFAAQLYPGMRRLEEKGAALRLAQFTQAACPPILGAGNFRPLCAAINDRVLAEIARLRPSTVVLAGDWFDVSTAVPGLLERLQGTAAALREAGITNVVLVGVFPKWSSPVPRAMVGAMRQSDGVTMPERMQPLATAAVQRRLDVIAAETRITSARPCDVLCDASGCLTATKAADGEIRLVFFDGAHLTEDGSEYVAARLLKGVVPGL